MSSRLLVCACVLSGCFVVDLPPALAGQTRPAGGTTDSASASGSAPEHRGITVLAGGGNALGWFGGQVERYFTEDRYSAFGGFGYTPASDSFEPSGPTFAVGARGFTSGSTHRAFLELSISQILTVTRAGWASSEEGPSFRVESDRLYGPGLQVGYQFASSGGFTALISVGGGYGIDSEVGGFGLMGGLGIGYTWRGR